MICDLLAKAKVSNGNGVTTPMLSTSKLNRHGYSPLPNSYMYRSMVGALQYVTLTRPDSSV